MLENINIDKEESYFIESQIEEDNSKYTGKQDY